MKKGKAPENVLDRAVFKQIKLNKEEAVTKPRIGGDYQELDFKEYHTVTSNAFLPYLHSGDGIVVLKKALNNFMVSRGIPVALEIIILMPVKTEESLLRTIMKEISDESKREDIKVMGGHTEWVEGINTPMMTLHIIGKKEPDVKVIKPEAEDEIILTKAAGILGTYQILQEKKQELKERFSGNFLDKEEILLDKLSIRKEAEVLRELEVGAIHDVSKGGIFAGLWELAKLTQKGLEVDLTKIPLEQITVEVCEQYDLNPYQLDGSGTLLFVTKKGAKAILELEKAGIAAKSIGYLTDTKDRVVYNEEERRFLEPFRKEESHKII